VTGGCASATDRCPGARGGDRGPGHCKGEKVRGLICIEVVCWNRAHSVVVILG
jgi:hypothetical protein